MFAPPRIATYDAPHIEGVKALWAQAFPNPQAWNAPEFTIAAKCALQPELFIVALDGERVIGTAMGGYDGHRGWLYAIAVLKTYRRKGVGTALVREVERRLIATGCIKINLQVHATNAEVAAFYGRLGYGVEDRISMGKRVGKFA